MILHFVIDGKLTDQIIDNFLAVSTKNHFLVFGKKTDDQNFFRITRQGDFLSVFIEGRDDINVLLLKIKPQAIVLHSLANEFARAIVKIEKKIPICWFEWGFDVYGLPKIEKGLYAPKTRLALIFNSPKSVVERFFFKYDLFRKFYLEKIKHKDDMLGIVLKAISRIDYFATYIEEEFKIFKKYYPEFKLQLINSTFSTIDQYLAGDKNFRIFPAASNILIGNSSSPTSNHLDAFAFLSKHPFDYGKVFVVLSYGSEKIPIKLLIERGKQLLKSRFIPLTEFMTRDKYIELLQSCSVGIFYHYRQQAMGNIIAMLYMGARVYLSKRNPAYGFFMRNEIIVNAIEDDYVKYGNTRLNLAQAAQNRSRLDLLFGEEKVISDLKNLTELITKTRCQ